MPKQNWELSILRDPIALSTQVGARRWRRPVANALAMANHFSTIFSHSTSVMPPIVSITRHRQTFMEKDCLSSVAAYIEHPTTWFSRRSLIMNRRSTRVEGYCFDANISHTSIPSASAEQCVQHVWINRTRQTISPEQVAFNHRVHQHEMAK